MKIVVSSDFVGLPLKTAVAAHLQENGHEVVNVGQQEGGEKVIFVDAVRQLVKEIQNGSCERGIVMCGTGGGVSIAANKCKGIYCVACESIFTAENCPVINNANVLAMGSRVVGADHACRMADAWLEQSFCKGFTEERAEFVHGLIEQLYDMENENFK